MKTSGAPLFNLALLMLLLILFPQGGSEPAAPQQSRLLLLRPAQEDLAFRRCTKPRHPGETQFILPTFEEHSSSTRPR